VQQVYFSYANLSSDTYFAATLRHIPSAYFWHTICNNITAHTLHRQCMILHTWIDYIVIHVIENKIWINKYIYLFDIILWIMTGWTR
jgi:hypothetical protein